MLTSFTPYNNPVVGNTACKTCIFLTLQTVGTIDQLVSNLAPVNLTVLCVETEF